MKHVWMAGALMVLPTLAPAAGRRALPDAGTQAVQLRQAEQARQAGLAAQQAAAAAEQQAQARADALAEQRVEAAERLRGAEAATEAAAARMSRLAADRAEAERQLAQQADNLGPLLPLIERLALYPLETLLAIPAAPDQTLLGATVLSGITRDMERQARILARRRAAVAALTEQMQAEAPRLAAAENVQALQAQALDAQIVLAHQTMTRAEQDRVRAAQAAADAASRAASLRDAIAAIEAERAREEQAAAEQAAAAARHRKGRLTVAPVPLAGPGIGAPRGDIGPPVTGTLIKAFGAPTDAGPATGISYASVPAARVVAPCTGSVEFAAPFRSYGRLLILACGGGYHFVLAGLDRLDTEVGRSVRRGEPLGTMPGWDPRVPGSRPALYMELRHGGIAIDPAPFLRGR